MSKDADDKRGTAEPTSSKVTALADVRKRRSQAKKKAVLDKILAHAKKLRW